MSSRLDIVVVMGSVLSNASFFFVCDASQILPHGQVRQGAELLLKGVKNENR